MAALRHLEFAPVIYTLSIYLSVGFSYQSPTQREAVWMRSPHKRQQQETRGARQTPVNKDANKDALVRMVRVSKKEYEKEKTQHKKEQGQGNGGKGEQQQEKDV